MFIVTGPYFHPCKPWRGGPKPRRWGHVTPPGLRKIFLNDYKHGAPLELAAGAKTQQHLLGQIEFGITGIIAGKRERWK